MPGRAKDVDRSSSPSPNLYNIPSKVIENQGKSFGLRLQSSLVSASALRNPGPGQYQTDKPKKDNYKFSMGTKNSALKSNTMVPGPGSYN
jgi:hypothetical protein